MPVSEELLIRSALPVEEAAALELIFSRVEPPDRAGQIDAALAACAAGAGELFVAERAGRIVAAGLFQCQPGRAATVCPPRTVPGEAARTAERVLAALLDRVSQRSVRLAYALLDELEIADHELFRTRGFGRLAALLYLVCPADRFPQTAPEGLLTFLPCGPEQRARLERVLAATYEDTLDCPALNGIRDLDDVLAGYGLAADPALMLIARHGADDAGCLLLADHPDFGNLELAYMGLAKRARGKGWGKIVVHQAQSIARRLGRQRLVVAVDESNAPAIAAYERAGFEAWDRRICCFRLLHPGAAGCD
jgi:GNAT superfamily N-acetyltransferase